MKKLFVIVLLSTLCPLVHAESRLINGTAVNSGSFPQVVRIMMSGSACTATIVGRNVIITAAHCAKTGQEATFKLSGKTYRASMNRSPLYPGKDHDINVGILSEDVPSDLWPVTIGGTAEKGKGVTILGYGCTRPGGTGGNDGILRIGDSAITGFSNYDFVSRKSGGGALCYGDSGGPTMTEDNGRLVLLGINSKGNIQDTSYQTRLDLPESQDFLNKIADEKNLEICGINIYCD